MDAMGPWARGVIADKRINGGQANKGIIRILWRIFWRTFWPAIASAIRQFQTAPEQANHAPLPQASSLYR